MLLNDVCSDAGLRARLSGPERRTRMAQEARYITEYQNLHQGDREIRRASTRGTSRSEEPPPGGREDHSLQLGDQKISTSSNGTRRPEEPQPGRPEDQNLHQGDQDIRIFNWRTSLRRTVKNTLKNTLPCFKGSTLWWRANTPTKR